MESHRWQCEMIQADFNVQICLIQCGLPSHDSQSYQTTAQSLARTCLCDTRHTPRARTVAAQRYYAGLQSYMRTLGEIRKCREFDAVQPAFFNNSNISVCRNRAFSWRSTLLFAPPNLYGSLSNFKYHYNHVLFSRFFLTYELQDLYSTLIL